MNSETYKQGVMKTESLDVAKIQKRIDENKLRLIHASMGLSTESAEFLDAMKKHVFYGKDLDSVNIKEELGDCLWYLFVALDVFGWTLEEVMQLNHDKLKKRYGNSFSEDKAINRNVREERELLSR